MVSPAVQVKDGAAAYVGTDNGVDVTPGNTVVIKLLDSSADSWSIGCITTDELSVAATINASLVIDPIARTATFTAPAAARGLRFMSMVNSGLGPDKKPKSSYSTTFAIFTKTAANDRVITADETTESNATFGWIAKINSIIRRVADLFSAQPFVRSLSVNYTNATNALTDTLLAAPIAANEIRFFLVDLTNGCSGIGGVKYAVNAPGGASIEGEVTGFAGSATAATSSRLNALNTATTNAFCTVAGTLPTRMWFRIKNGATPGTVVVRAQSVTNGQTSTVYAGSTIFELPTVEV